ncbi:hypothetical protein KR032_003752 [Drosophila birchii]|nr:hypothetical protein KR032_003752 [Drosophila birchii]
MRVVRMNFSHGSHEYHAKTIKEARKAIAMYQEETGMPKTVALALDTKGPEIRTGKLAESGDTAEVQLEPGDKVTLSTNKELENNVTKDKIYVDYQQLPSIVKPGNRVFLDDGLIALVVKESQGEEVVCEVENGGKLGSHKGVNLPGLAVDLPAITEKDKQDLQFGVDQKVDMIFASFIRDAKAVADVRQALGPEGKRIKVISKIENQQGLTNIDKIIHASDGIMVARGDLGIEIPTENVPLAQKMIIAKCNIAGKPVICATQMLDSMTTKPRPSRAEASDVANAIFDGADAVMLSGETAKGKYPAEAVRVMAKICAKTESVLWYENIQNHIKQEIRNSGGDHISAVATSIADAAAGSQARAIVVASPCSMMAQMISHIRPPCPVVMLTGCPAEASQSMVFRGLHPLLVEDMAMGNSDFQQIMDSGLKLVSKMDLIEPGEKGTVVLVDAMSADKITFRLFTIQQQTKAEREQEERCQKLAQEERCKKRAAKLKKEREMNEEENGELDEDEERENELKLKCKELKAKQKQKQTAERCKQLLEAEKGKSPEEKEKEEAQLKIIDEALAKFEVAQKEKLAEMEAKKKEDLAKCKQMAEERKKKEEEEKSKRQEAEKKKAEMAKKLKKVRAAKQKKKDSELCKKLREEKKKSKKDMANELVKIVCKKLNEVKDSSNKDTKK